MKYLIATTATPKDFTLFCKNMRKIAQETNLHIVPGILWTSGPGCTNLAFEIIGNDEECLKYAEGFTMALQPAKFCTTADKLPPVDTYEL